MAEIGKSANRLRRESAEEGLEAPIYGGS